MPIIALIYKSGKNVSNLELCYQSIYYRGGSRISSWGGGAIKKIAQSGGRRENCWGISCEKS